MVPVEGLEPPTPGSEDQCSNPLSYTGINTLNIVSAWKVKSNLKALEF